ncbi:MAG: hypothetical protein Q8L34_06470 [Candidatus Woesearchaeota archaeon]|nr:hypothetical protein [Candidatus Woesearchaeota archaeon]
MAERTEATEPRNMEEALKGHLVVPRPGHSFDDLDVSYFEKIGARVETVVAPEEDSSN